GDIIADRNRAFLTVGHRAYALGIDPVLGEEGADGLGAPRAKGDVVFARAALVGMTFDGDGVLVVLLQPAGLIAQGLLRLWRQIGAVAGKVYEVPDIHGKIARRAPPG